MSTIKEKIAIMQAYEEGKIIEYKWRHDSNSVWIVSTCPPAWNWGDYDYRIKPEPLELELWYHIQTGTTCDVKPSDLESDWTSQGFRKIKVKEVL